MPNPKTASAYYGTRCEIELIEQIAENKGAHGLKKYLNAAKGRCNWGFINPDKCIEYAESKLKAA